jgi:hypothetical protein
MRALALRKMDASPSAGLLECPYATHGPLNITTDVNITTTTTIIKCITLHANIRRSMDPHKRRGSAVDVLDGCYAVVLILPTKEMNLEMDIREGVTLCNNPNE